MDILAYLARLSGRPLAFGGHPCSASRVQFVASEAEPCEQAVWVDPTISIIVIESLPSPYGGTSVAANPLPSALSGKRGRCWKYSDKTVSL